jgi:MFS family permease
MGVSGVPSIVVLIVLQSISGLGWAGIAVGGNSTVAHLAPAGHEGAALGVYTSFLSFGAIVGAFVSGFVVLWVGYAVAFALGAIGVALVVLALWMIRRRVPESARGHL